jgi:hypothetical protein
MRATDPPAGDEKSFPVTVFPNRFAKSKREQRFEIDELRDFVLSKQKRSKHRLPLIKLASFGDTPNESNCLRYDANVTIAYGIEVDYDREVIAFDRFVKKLRRATIRALIYTSPSCTPTRPRVRIILPFRKPLPRARLKRRGKFVSRIDGLFGGNVFGGESWTLSQTYYVGRDLSNADADFRAVVVKGDYIDERPDLERFEAISNRARQKVKANCAVAPRATKRAINRTNRNPYQSFGDEALLDSASEALSIMDYRERHGGKGVHHTQRDVSYQLIKRGLPDQEVIELVLTATLALPVAVKDNWNQKEEHKRIVRLCTGAHRRLAREQLQLLSLPRESRKVTLTFDEFLVRQRKQLEKIFRD